MLERDVNSTDRGERPRESGMQKPTVHITTRVGAEGPYRVDLPLIAGYLNERLFDIGLIEREIRTRSAYSWSPLTNAFA